MYDVQKAELGPNAFEEHMPARLRMQLEGGSTRNKERPTALIEILGRLCDLDQSVETVYLCHPAVRRLSKTSNEGNLCGYRNIQMMISYIIGAPAPGSEHFPNGLPSVLDLQDFIEQAWDKGINSEGRVETGGVRGTRKYIGTPEVRRPERGRFASRPSKDLPCHYWVAELFHHRRLKHFYVVSISAAGPVLTTTQKAARRHGSRCSTSRGTTSLPPSRRRSRRRHTRSIKLTSHPSTYSDHAILSPSSASRLGWTGRRIFWSSTRPLVCLGPWKRP